MIRAPPTSIVRRASRPACGRPRAARRALGTRLRVSNGAVSLKRWRRSSARDAGRAPVRPREVVEDARLLLLGVRGLVRAGRRFVAMESYARPRSLQVGGIGMRDPVASVATRSALQTYGILIVMYAQGRGRASVAARRDGGRRDGEPRLPAGTVIAGGAYVGIATGAGSGATAAQARVRRGLDVAAISTVAKTRIPVPARTMRVSLESVSSQCRWRFLRGGGGMIDVRASTASATTVRVVDASVVSSRLSERAILEGSGGRWGRRRARPARASSGRGSLTGPERGRARAHPHTGARDPSRARASDDRGELARHVFAIDARQRVRVEEATRSHTLPVSGNLPISAR